MNMQRSLFGLVIALIAFVGYHHFTEHPTADDIQKAIQIKEKADVMGAHAGDAVLDSHTHDVYWNGIGGGKLELIKNVKYGTPYAKPHRHTGLDYFQQGHVTWKHVDDQHVKLEK